VESYNETVAIKIAPLRSTLFSLLQRFVSRAARLRRHSRLNLRGDDYCAGEKLHNALFPHLAFLLGLQTKTKRN
jgi:hypothetical protein